jgi:cytochrome b/mono/diheme cytochrome c family protein
VWDVGVRVFHWGLVGSVGVCAYTGFLAPASWLGVHLFSGAVVAALVVFRVVWGLTGSTYARFESFPFSLSAVLKHFRDARSGTAHAELGHNPAGAAMVYTVLAALVLILVTGMTALAGVLKQGPLANAISFSIGRAALELHEWLAIGLLALIAAHLVGNAFESWRTKENLTRSMITGDKIGNPSEARPSVPMRPAAAAAILAVVAMIFVPAGYRLSSLPVPGVPSAALDPVYAKECGGCHFAYPPSLAGATTWTAVMAGLSDHFGENASLDAPTTKTLTDWLLANSGEHWDTLAAHAFRVANPADPQRITANAVWARIHRELPQAVFKSPKVGAKGACAACHGDAATGRFAPQLISVPKEEEL